MMVPPFLIQSFSFTFNSSLSSKNALVGSVGTYITNQGIFPGYME